MFTQVYTRVPAMVGCLCVIITCKGFHSSAHVSDHAVSPVRLSLVRFRPRERVGQGSRQAGYRFWLDCVALSCSECHASALPHTQICEIAPAAPASFLPMFIVQFPKTISPQNNILSEIIQDEIFRAAIMISYIQICAKLRPIRSGCHL